MHFNLLEEVKKFDAEGGRHLVIDVEVSRKIALSILEQYNYQGQRPRNQKHVAVLAEAMRRNEFREFTPIDFAVLNDTPHLVNGQHTLQAVSDVNKSIWLSFKFQKVNSAQDIEDIYSKFDIGRTRSMRDVMGTIGEELSLSVKERDALGGAVGWINRGLRPMHGHMNAVALYESRDFELKKSLMRAWSSEASTFFRCIDAAPGFNKNLFYRSAVLAVALITIRYDKERAVNFWAEAAIDDGLRNGDPRKALINWLRNNPCGKAINMQHRAAIACWNAWFKEKSLVKVYPNSDVSLKILGTPIDIAEVKENLC